ATLLERRGQPPEEGELSGLLNVPAPVLKKTLLLLEARKEAFRAGPFWFHTTWVEEAKRLLTELAKQPGGFSASEARERLQTTRKFIIPLLEALDERGFSRRIGDRRVLA